MSYNRNNIARGLAHYSYDPLNEMIRQEENMRKEEKLRSREEKKMSLSLERRAYLLSQFNNQLAGSSGWVPEIKNK